MMPRTQHAALVALVVTSCARAPEPVMPPTPVRTPYPKQAAAVATTLPPANPAPVASARPEAARQPAAVPTKALAKPSAPALPTEVAGFVDHWRDAWQRRALSEYMAYYADDFLGDGLDRAGWQDRKRRVFARAGTLRVEVENLAVRPEGERIVAEFDQVYTSDGLRDRGRKTLEIMRTSGGLRIRRESFVRR